MNDFLEYADTWAAQRISSFGALILKVKEGRIQFRVLDNKPVKRRVHFQSVGNMQIICPEENCVFCARKDQVTVQHYMNVVDRKDDKVKVLIFSEAVLDAIADMVRIVSEGSDDKETNHPRRYDVSVVRTGTTRQTTRYKATQIPDVPFESGKYTPYDLNKIHGLVPMPSQEMLKYQGEKPTAIATRKPKDAHKPVSSVVPSVDMENMLGEDDSVV